VILVDTSAWVEFDRATDSPAHRRLVQLIGETDEVAVTEPIVAEVVSGARDDAREAELRRLLLRFHLVPFHGPTHFEGAIKVYRSCRRQGVTPRGLIDCMIAAVALDADLEVLAHDVDFARIATVMALDLDPASLQPDETSG
jgi:predicted nucleic acid-binding protein